MAHTKAQGAVKGNRDSRAKRLGVKIYGGQTAINGNIIVRQKGTTFHAGDGALLGKDNTVYAIRDGVVTFKTVRGKQFIDIRNG